MSDRNRPDPHVDVAVQDTFPASDPAGHQVSSGSRAVPAEALLHAAGSKPPACPDGMVDLQAGFADQSAAKLALESLVREGPIDRRCAEIRREDDRVTLHVQAPAGDAERLRGLLQKHAGA